MNSDLKKLAVIILNYNSSELSIQATENILQMKTDAAIILVDNCSTDNSKEDLQERFHNDEQVYLVFLNENVGYACGNNIGINFINNLDREIDAVLIMNPDVEVPDVDILKCMYDVLFKDRKIGALTVKTVFNGEMREPNECAWHFLSKSYMVFGGTIFGKKKILPKYYSDFCVDSNGVSRVDVVQGCFFMIRLDTFCEVGLFDSNTFLYSEESILAQKLTKKGYRNGVLPNLYIMHNHKEKGKKLQNYKNKIFDMTCYYDSRKYYIENYSGASCLFIKCAKVFLNVDFFIKKIIQRIRLRNKN